jgi:hypothetical protein
MNLMSADMLWFHVVLTAYGAWLPGDPRGFRTRHHREHVEGDYKNPPPPGVYEARHAKSKQLLKFPPMIFPTEHRKTIGMAAKDKIEKLGGQVIAIAVADKHVHFLAKMPWNKAYEWAGAAKRHVWFEMREVGRSAKLWAKEPWARTIKDRGPAQRLLVHRSPSGTGRLGMALAKGRLARGLPPVGLHL